MEESKRPRTFLAELYKQGSFYVHEAADGTNWISLIDICDRYGGDYDQAIEQFKAYDGGRHLMYIGGIPFARA